MASALEKLQQVQETLAEIKERTPGVSISSFVSSVLDVDSPGTYAPSEWNSGDAGRHGRRRRAESLKMDWAACVVPFHVFARALMANALATAERVANARRRGLPRLRRRRLCPMKVLERAYKNAAMDETPGGSTAVIVSLDGGGAAAEEAELRWAYIGDSAFAVLRGGKIIHRSAPQQSRFNEPYQLSTGGHGHGGSLAEAEAGGMSSAVEDGDVVVVGTDGLFDNVHDWQLERAVGMGTGMGFTPKNMADVVAGIAYVISKNSCELSPYGIGYFEEYKKVWLGGKVDDITVLVAYIVSKDS